MGTIREIRNAAKQNALLTPSERKLMPYLERVIDEFEADGYERDRKLVDELFDVLNHATYPSDTYTVHVAWAACRFAQAALRVHREYCEEQRAELANNTAAGE